MKVLGFDLPWEAPTSVIENERTAGLLRVLSEGEMPTESLEEWRYGPISDLDLASFSPSPLSSVAQLVSDAEVDELLKDWSSRLGKMDLTLVLVDGHLLRTLIVDDADIQLDAGGADRSEAGEEFLPNLTIEPFVALNRVFSEPIRILVSPSNRQLRVLVLHIPSGNRSLDLPRIEVELLGGSSAELIEVRGMGGGEGSGLGVPSTSLTLGDKAHLQYVCLQAEPVASWELAYLDATLGTESVLNSLHVALGAQYARLRTDCNMKGRGAQANIYAAYLGGFDQTLEFRTFQNHSAAKTTSNLLYKGAVAGDSHSIYSGMIRIDKGAVGSNAFQTNRNLVLSESAHADSVPNLDIQENDVRCSHASAVGPLDEEQLYYLEGRGISTRVAEKLIVRGFFKEFAHTFGSLPLMELVEKSLEEKW